MNTTTEAAARTVAEILRDRHDAYEARRIAAVVMLPGVSPLPEGYTARPFKPLWVSPDRSTVVSYSSAWTWGYSHRRDEYGDPIRLLLEMLETLTPDPKIGVHAADDPDGFTEGHGNFAEFSGAFQVATSDPVIAAALHAAARKD